MLGVLEHDAQQAGKRLGKPLTKSRCNREDLVCLRVFSGTAHAKGFIQIHTEYGVGYFEVAKTTQISVRFFAFKGHAPILRH